MTTLRRIFGLALFAALTFSCASKSETNTSERVWKGTDPAGTDQYVTLRKDDGKWVLTRFEVKPGELQESLGEERFEDSKEAESVAIRIAESLRLTQSRTQPARSSGLLQSISEVPGEVLWKATEIWDWSWELRFSEWIASELTLDQLKKLHISTDCADLPYVLRWIFARIYGLPAANHLAGSSQWFTNESVRESWLGIPTSEKWYEDRRFLAALNYLMVNTYTHSLAADSYPIKINAESMIPGALFLDLDKKDSGHTQVVYKLNVTDKELAPLVMVYSTIPREVRTLYMGTFWEGAQPDAAVGGGFMRFRWPVRSSDGKWTLVSGPKMPYFSREQYSKGFMGEEKFFSDIVELKIIGPDYDPMVRLKAGLQRLREKVTNRQDFVLRGFAACSKGQCPKGSKGYEDWSTPARDKSISDLFVLLGDFVAGKAWTRPDLITVLETELRTDALTLSTGQVLTLWDIRQNFSSGHFSSEPADSVLKRWGLE